MTTSTNHTGIRAQDDFPTAAEVAQGIYNCWKVVRRSSDLHAVSTSARKMKIPDTKEVAETVAAAHKQARSEEADTFRGLHLDPNAHHWDEVSLFENVLYHNSKILMIHISLDARGR